MAIIFRTAGAWGSGKGSNLVPVEVDQNFYDLLQGLTALQDNPPEAISIVSFTVTGDQMYVNMSDNSVLGPYTLPMGQWVARGEWQPNTAYSRYDVVAMNGACYLVMLDHISAPSFDPGANGGSGLDYYGLIMEAPGNVLPPGGVAGQLLAKVDDTDFNMLWVDPPPTDAVCDIGFSYPEKLDGSGKTLFQYIVSREMFIPANLAGSMMYIDTAPQSTVLTVEVQSINIGDADWTSLGTFGWGIGENVGTLQTSYDFQWFLSPGDMIRIIGPNATDIAAANLSISIVGTRT